MGRKTRFNSITSPELISQISRENTRLMDDYLEYLRSVGRSPNTIEQYRSDLLIAFVWNLQNNDNTPFVKWTKRNIIAFQNWALNQNENSPARVRRLKATLSSLSNYIECVLDDEYPDFRNIIKKIESPINNPVREKTVWEDQELQNLLDMLVERKQYEKACLLALGMYSGRRKAELARFKVSDFDDSNLVCDGALYKSAPIKTKGRGNGKMMCCYTLAKKFKPYFDLWMKERNENGIDSEWLFPDRSNPKEHINPDTFNSWADLFTRLSGKEMYLHSLRHYFSTFLARSGIPDGVIQSIIQWQSSDMVRLYCDLDPEDQIGMYFKDGDISVPEKKGLNDL